MPAY
ncbi:uncharacterized protein FFC1_08636 [Fusarium fujikuroi]